MKTLIAAILATLISLIPAATFAETETETEMLGYVSQDGSTIILIAHVDAGDDTTAELVVAELDEDAIEDAFDVTVIETTPLDRDTRSGLGVNDGTLYSVYDADITGGLVLVTYDGPDVYIGLMVGDRLDGELFATMTWDAINEDMDVTTPDGYTEVPLDDDDPLFEDSSL